MKKITDGLKRIMPTSFEVWNTLSKTEKKYLKTGLNVILFIGVLSTFLVPWALTWKFWSLNDYSNTGQIGDTIGGISAPFIGILSAILTFLAFYIQYKANNQQRDQFSQELSRQRTEDIEREKSWRIERFENKFYELLRLHKSNVNEISIVNKGSTSYTSNRTAFVEMFYEFKFTFFYCKARYNELKDTGRNNLSYNDEQLVRLAYIFFYCGVGDNSDIISRAMNLNPTLKFDEGLFNTILSGLTWIKENNIHSSIRDDDFHEVPLNMQYKPWCGHQSHLGHYYRHLFQTVKYVVSQDDELLSIDVKKDYLRSLRAQLSDFEQLMLYYNAIANFGDAWIHEGYFTRFRMIHNIPIPLANFGKSPQEKFGKELALDHTLFEWLE